MIDKNNKKLCFYIYLALLLITGVLGQFFDLMHGILVILLFPFVIFFAIAIILLMIWIAINAYSYVFEDILKINFKDNKINIQFKKSANEELKEYTQKLMKQKENKK